MSNINPKAPYWVYRRNLDGAVRMVKALSQSTAEDKLRVIPGGCEIIGCMLTLAEGHERIRTELERLADERHASV